MSNMFHWEAGNMRKLTTIVLLILLPAIVQAQGLLEARGSLPKDTYVYAEPVDVEVVFTNTSNQVVHKNEIKEVGIVVLDEAGKSLSSCISEVHFSAVEKEYQPQESSGNIFNLNDYYAPLFSFYLYARAFPVGNYTVLLAYYNADSVRIEQKLPFRVVEPVGEDAVVFTKLKFHLNENKPKYPTFGILIDSLESLYWQYPNSIYTRIAMPAIIAYYRVFKKDEASCLKYYDEIFTKYPDTGMGMMYCRGLLREMRSDAEKESFLQRLQKTMKSKAGQLYLESNLRKLKNQ